MDGLGLLIARGAGGDHARGVRGGGGLSLGAFLRGLGRLHLVLQLAGVDGLDPPQGDQAQHGDGDARPEHELPLGQQGDHATASRASTPPAQARASAPTASSRRIHPAPNTPKSARPR